MVSISIVKGDITKMNVDAIVVPTDQGLLRGSKLSEEIHKLGGLSVTRQILNIVTEYGLISFGEAVYTSGGDLPAKYLIHTVAPAWKHQHHSKWEEDQFKSCYINSFKLAEKCGAKSIAFPCIGTGFSGFPKKLAAEIALKTVLNILHETNWVDEVYFVCKDKDNYDIYVELVKRNFGLLNEDNSGSYVAECNCKDFIGNMTHTEDDYQGCSCEDDYQGCFCEDDYQGCSCEDDYQGCSCCDGYKEDDCTHNGCACDDLCQCLGYTDEEESDQGDCGVEKPMSCCEECYEPCDCTGYHVKDNSFTHNIVKLNEEQLGSSNLADDPSEDS